MEKELIKRIRVHIKNDDGTQTEFIKELTTIQQQENAAKIAFSILQGGCFDEKSNILYPSHRIDKITLS